MRHRVACLVCLGLLLVACGDDDGGGSGGASGTSGTGGSGGESGTSGTGGSGGESGTSGMGGAGAGGAAADAGADDAGTDDDAGDDLDAMVALDADLPDADLSDAGDPDAGCTTLACQPCVTGQCGNHGTCMQTNQGPECTCDTGYTGAACSDCAQSYVVSSSTGLCVIPQQRQRTVHELRGTNCPAGGTATLSGLDLNDDGTLSDNEVTSIPTYQCFTPMVRNGSVSVTNLAELQALEGVTEITGGLYISAPTITNLDPLSVLTRVGSLSIVSNTLLTNTAGLDALERIDGAITIQDNPVLADVDGFAETRIINGALLIEGNPTLAHITGFDQVGDLGGALTIRNNSGLVDLDGFDALETILGSFTIVDNDALTTIAGFESLIAVSGNVDISDNAQLASISGLSALYETGQFSLINNPMLSTTPGLETLHTVRGSFNLSGNAFVTLSGFNGLVVVQGTFTLRNNQALLSITGFNALETLGTPFGFEDALTIDYNPALLVVDGFDSLSDLGGNADVIFYGNTSLTTLTGFPAVTAIREVQLWGPSPINDLSPFSSSTTVGTWEIRGMSGSLALASAASIGQLSVENNAELTAFSAPGLTSAGSLAVRYNPLLTSIDLSTVESIGATRNPESPGLLVGNNAVLASINLEGLTVASAIYISEFVGTTLGTWSSATDLGLVDIYNNPNLTSLPTAPALTDGLYTLRALSNPMLADLGFEALTELQGCDDAMDGGCCSLDVSGSPLITTLSIGDSAMTLGGLCISATGITSLAGAPWPSSSLMLYNNGSLTSLSGVTPAALDFLAISGNAQLATCEADALAIATGASETQISGNDDAGTCN